MVLKLIELTFLFLKILQSHHYLGEQILLIHMLCTYVYLCFSICIVHISKCVRVSFD